jgi:hypothetical protein
VRRWRHEREPRWCRCSRYRSTVAVIRWSEPAVPPPPPKAPTTSRLTQRFTDVEM